MLSGVMVRRVTEFNKKNNYLKKKPTMVQICRLENIEHKSMKQVLIVVNIPSQLVELMNLIYNSLL